MSFLAAAIVVHDTHHRKAAPLYERLVDEGVTVAICPTITDLEFRSVLWKKALKLTPHQVEEVIEDAQRRLRSGQLMLPHPAPTDPAEIRRFFFGYAERLLNLYLGQVRRAEFRLTKGLMAHARECMLRWNLNAQDGVMLALAEEAAGQAGCLPHMATYDGAFREVDGLHVWGEP
jgi:predicted nucleic acid-binding protein